MTLPPPHRAILSGGGHLRVVTALLCTTWPSGRDMIDPDARGTVDEHVRALSAGSRQAFDRPPREPAATAALLTAASTLLDAPDLGVVLAQHTRATREGRPSRTPWTQVFDRHESSCSENLRQAAAPVTRAYRRTGLRGTKAPVRADGYRPEHIPAFLEQHWYQTHLAPLQLGSRTKSLRRLGAVLLVQWTAGGAMGDAADFLGINPAGGQYAATTATCQWLSNQAPDRFTKALRNIAEDLDPASGLINYRRRREALRNWSLTPGTWHEIITSLPPVPGPVRPSLDDRKRQEASAFIWARITGGEPLFAPRPIEAGEARPRPPGLAPAPRHHMVPTRAHRPAQPLCSPAGAPQPARRPDRQEDRPRRLRPSGSSNQGQVPTSVSRLTRAKQRAKQPRQVNLGNATYRWESHAHPQWHCQAGNVRYRTYSARHDRGPRRYDVTITVDRDGGHSPNPADQIFDAGAGTCEYPLMTWDFSAHLLAPREEMRHNM